MNKLLILIIILFQFYKQYKLENCIIKCFDKINNNNEISCYNDESMMIRMKRSNKIVFDYPIGIYNHRNSDNLPESLKHLKCLKQFSCKRPKTTTTTLRPPENDDIDEYYDNITTIYDKIKNETKYLMPNKFNEILIDLNKIINKFIMDETIDNYLDRIELTKSSLSIIDNLLLRKNTWYKMNNQDRLNNTDRILFLVEQLPLFINKKLSNQYDDNDDIIIKIICKNITMQSSKYFLSNDNDNKTINYNINKTEILLPSLSFLINNDTSSLKTTTTTTTIIDNKNLMPKICGRQNNNLDYRLINTPIISIIIGEHNESIHFPESNYLNFKTKNHNRLLFGDQSNCYYWNKQEKCWSNNGCYYRKYQSNRIERKNDEPNLLCQTISLILLFSLLTMICFTFLKCFHCSWFIVFSPLGVSISSIYYLIIGYLTPILIIIIGIIWIYINETKHVWKDVFESLCGRYFCWISSYEYRQHIWLFLGPLYFLLITNCILFTLIMYRYCTSRIHHHKRLTSSKTKQIFSILINSFLFFCNFGLTWLLSIYYINELIPISKIFSILFILLNGSQGLFLLIEQIFRFIKQNNNNNNSRYQSRQQKQQLQQQKTLSTRIQTSSLSLSLNYNDHNNNSINNNNNSNDKSSTSSSSSSSSSSTKELIQQQQQKTTKNKNPFKYLSSLISFRKILFIEQIDKR